MFRIKSSKSIVGEKSIEVHWSTLWKLLLIRICKPRILNLKLFCGHGNVHLQLSKERKFTEVSLCQTSGTLNLSKIWIFLHFSVFCFTPTSAVLNIQAQAERGSALFWATGIYFEVVNQPTGSVQWRINTATMWKKALITVDTKLIYTK